MVLRWTALVTGLGILLMTHLIARRLMSWPFAAAAALMTTVWGWFLVTPNFYSLQAALFALVALWCYLRYVDGGNCHPIAQSPRDGGPGFRWILIAGVVTGLTALVKQNVGAYAAVAIVASIWLSRHKSARATALFIGGICIPVVPTLLFLILSGAGPYLYESWVYYPDRESVV